jgi:uncharacterized membrane protein YGL010W
MARTADAWFEAYGHSHQNPVNELIHWLCVPTITVSLLGLLWDLPTLGLEQIAPWFHWTYILVAVAMVFYLRMSLSIALGMGVFTAGVIVLFENWHHITTYSMWPVALGLFVLAWIFQFIGHKIEGEKPSFFDDIKFLLVGPAWLLHFIYKRLGIAY